MKRILILSLLITCLQSQAQTNWTDDLVLTPERSNFDKTSTHADVMSFINAIKSKSPYIQVTTIGKSTMGKDIPLVILSNPAVSTPEQAKALGKPVIYIQGNIHAGEVEG